MRKVFSFIACASALAALASCVNEPKGDNSSQVTTDLVVSFQVGGSPIETKSLASRQRTVPEQLGRIELSEPGDKEEVFLVSTVRDMDDYYFPQNVVATKGIPVYTENFATIHPSFGAVAYTQIGTQFQEGVQSFTLADADLLRYSYDFGATTMPEEGLLFFLSAPAAPSTATYNMEGSIAFSYESPSKAEDQADILFTSKAVTPQSYDRAVILFYHALAGVKFKAANIEDDITAIKSIKIKGAYSKGNCVVHGEKSWDYTASNSNATPDASVPKSWADGVVVWSDKEVVAEKIFVADGLDTVSYSAANKFPESFNAGDKNLGMDNLNAADFSKTFMIIPQTTPAGCEVEITYSINGAAPIVKSIPFAGQSWLPGKMYTYTISANHVDVTITDTMTENDSKKVDPVITNTGNADAYMRVAVIGNWFDTHSPHQIVASWTPTDVADWKFDDTFADPQYWTLGEDGYYYYKFVVKPGDTIKHPLFKSYTVAPGSGKVPSTAHLEIDLMVQAVDAKKIADVDAALWTVKFTDYTYDPDPENVTD